MLQSEINAYKLHTGAIFEKIQLFITSVNIFYSFSGFFSEKKQLISELLRKNW